MIDKLFSNLENWFESRDYKCLYLIKDKERILTVFKSTAPTSILGICREKQLICIGLFCGDNSGNIDLGFSEFTTPKSLDDVIDKIQELQGEIYAQTQVPYLNELMRRREIFEEPNEIIREYAQRFGYNLIISQTQTIVKENTAEM